MGKIEISFEFGDFAYELYNSISPLLLLAYARLRLQIDLNSAKFGLSSANWGKFWEDCKP